MVRLRCARLLTHQCVASLSFMLRPNLLSPLLWNWAKRALARSISASFRSAIPRLGCKTLRDGNGLGTLAARAPRGIHGPLAKCVPPTCFPARVLAAHCGQLTSLATWTLDHGHRCVDSERPSL
ncbi:hypothetical protein B0H19DRAFT_1187365 [Mycena capillaripes]|nr:hypothetical protein B0H19DRAFT_1187365 [Mycena capillaripes]